MPHNIQLISKTTDTACRFAEIDNIMCRHFNVEPDPCKYYFNWYNILGFEMALGADFNKLRNEFPEFLTIIDYLDSNYTVKTWYSRE